VATAWTEALDLLAPSLPAALRTHVEETVAALSAAVDGGAWAIKRQGGEALAAAVRALAADVGAGMGPSGKVTGLHAPTVTEAGVAVRRCVELAPFAAALAGKLTAGLAGRLFDGKESLVAALGELAARCPVVDAAATAAAIAPQATKATASPEYVAVALDALALLGASCDADTAVADGVAAAVVPAAVAVLTRFGRIAPSSDLAAKTAPPATTASASAGAGAPSLLGGRMDEDKESEKRAQVKAAAESQSVAVASAAVALGTAGLIGSDAGVHDGVVRALTAVVSAASGSGSMMEGLHAVRAAAFAFSRLTHRKDGSPDLDAPLRGLAEAVWRVAEGEERYPTVRVAALSAGAVALHAATTAWSCGDRGQDAVAALARRLLTSPDGRVSAAAAGVVAAAARVGGGKP